MIDKIGKVYFVNNECYLISGYNFLWDNYYSYPIHSYFDSIDLNWNYKIPRNAQFLTISEAIEEIDKKISKNTEIIDNKTKNNLFDNHIEIKDTNYVNEFDRLCEAYVETQKRYRDIKRYSEVETKYKEIYIKEKKNMERGIKRLNKRIYHFYRENFDKIIESLNNGVTPFCISHDIYVAKNNIANLKKIKKYLTEMSKKFSDIGEWIDIENDEVDFECSICKGLAPANMRGDHNIRTRFCPNCGKRMINPIC